MAASKMCGKMATNTTKDEKYSRLILMLAKGGTKITRALFEKCFKEMTPKDHDPFPWTLDEFLQANKEKILSNQTGRGKKWMFFPVDSGTEIDRWDLSMFCYVLVNICGVSTAIRMDIVQLKRIRDKLCHLSEPSVDTKKYEENVLKIKYIFVRLLEVIDDTLLTEEIAKVLQAAKEEPLSHQDTINVMHDFFKMEEETREILSEHSKDIKEIRGKMVEVEKKVDLILKNQKQNLTETVKVPEIIIELLVKNCESDNEVIISKQLVDMYKEVTGKSTSDKHSKEEYSKMMAAVRELVDRFTALDRSIVDAEQRCIIFRIRCTSVASLLSLFDDCIAGDLNKEFKPLEACIREIRGCEEVTLEAVMYEDEVWKTISKTISSLEEMISRLYNTEFQSSVGSQKSDIPTISDVNLVERHSPTSEDEKRIHHAVRLTIRTDQDGKEQLKESVEKGSFDSSINHLRDVVVDHYDLTKLSIEARVVDEESTSFADSDAIHASPVEILKYSGDSTSKDNKDIEDADAEKMREREFTREKVRLMGEGRRRKMPRRNELGRYEERRKASKRRESRSRSRSRSSSRGRSRSRERERRLKFWKTSNMSLSKVQFERLKVFQKPRCLIQTAKDGFWGVEEDTVDELKKVDMAVNVVGIAGLYRTGKSYLMNRLAGEKSGFALGTSIQPKTKGIWVWCQHHPTQKDQILLLLDTEGLEGDNDHDNKLFVLTTLLSSTLMYNTMTNFNPDGLEQLMFITEMAKNLKMSEKDSSDDNFDLLMPEFVLCVRDFTLDLEIGGRECSEDEYLENCLREKNKFDVKYNQTRRCIKKYFTKRKAFTFDRPATRCLLKTLDEVTDDDLSKDFVEETKKFTSYIYKCPPKMLLNKKLVTGRMLAELLTVYVDAIKHGKVPCIDDALTVMSKAENRGLVENAIQKFKEILGQIPIPVANKDILLSKCSKLQTEILTDLKQKLLYDDDRSVEKSAKVTMEELYQRREAENSKQLYKKCYDLLTKMYEQEIKGNVTNRKYTLAGGYNMYKKDMNRIFVKYRKQLVQKKVEPIEIQRAETDFKTQKTPEIEKIMSADKNISEKEKEEEIKRSKTNMKQEFERTQKQERERYDEELQRQNKRHEEQMEATRKAQKKEDEAKQKAYLEETLARRQEMHDLKREVDRLKSQPLTGPTCVTGCIVL